MELSARLAYKWRELWPGPKNSKRGSIPLSAGHGIQFKEVVMLRWALGFFIVALVAAVLGFGGIALAAAGIAKMLFYLFLILFLVTLVGHLLRRSG